MSNEELFWYRQFAKRGIPKGSGKYEDYEACKKVVQLQSKLSTQIYDECLKIATKYCGV